MTELESIVARQLNAYNARDIDAFMACWHNDAEIFEHPNTLLASGAPAIRARHVTRFQEPDLFGRLAGRFSVANVVVDREIVTRNFPEGRGTVDVLAIYEVRDGKIAKATFKSGPKRLDTASDWEERIARAWTRFRADEIAEADLVPIIDALAADRPLDDPAATFERACARDSTGLEADAETLYRQALSAGLDPYRHARAIIQLASTLRNLNRLEESETLLRHQLEQLARSPSPPMLADETRAFLALTLASRGNALEAVGHALIALAPHLTRYNRSATAYAQELLDAASPNTSD